MNQVAVRFRRFGWFALVWVAGLLQPLALWAKDEKPEPETMGFTMGYILVLLFIVLGLMAVCRSTRLRPKKTDD